MTNPFCILIMTLSAVLVSACSNSPPDCDDGVTIDTLDSIVKKGMVSTSFSPYSGLTQTRSAAIMVSTSGHLELGRDTQAKKVACAARVKASQLGGPSLSLDKPVGYIIELNQSQEEYQIRTTPLDYLQAVYSRDLTTEDINLRGSPIGKDLMERLIRERLDEIQTKNEPECDESCQSLKLLSSADGWRYNDLIHDIDPLAPCEAVSDNEYRCRVVFNYVNNSRSILSSFESLSGAMVAEDELVFTKQNDLWQLSRSFDEGLLSE